MKSERPWGIRWPSNLQQGLIKSVNDKTPDDQLVKFKLLVEESYRKGRRALQRELDDDLLGPMEGDR